MPASKPDTSHGFRPSVPYSEDIVRPANEILRLDGRLETRLLSTQLHQVVLGVARLRNAVSSLRMEGEVVEMDRARAVLDGGRPTSPTEDGFLRLAKAYGGLSRGVLPELSIRGIVQKHRELFDGVLESAPAGRLKTEQNSIISPGTGRPIFLPTPPKRVEAELNALPRLVSDQLLPLPFSSHSRAVLRRVPSHTPLWRRQWPDRSVSQFRDSAGSSV